MNAETQQYYIGASFKIEDKVVFPVLSISFMQKKFQNSIFAYGTVSPAGFIFKDKTNYIYFDIVSNEKLKISDKIKDLSSILELINNLTHEY